MRLPRAKLVREDAVFVRLKYSVVRIWSFPPHGFTGSVHDVLQLSWMLLNGESFWPGPYTAVAVRLEMFNTPDGPVGALVVRAAAVLEVVDLTHAAVGAERAPALAPRAHQPLHRARHACGRIPRAIFGRPKKRAQHGHQPFEEPRGSSG